MLDRVIPRITSLRLVCCLAFPALAQSQVISVSTVNDVVDFGGLQRVSDLPGPDGKISMREACIAANNTPGPQTIGFRLAVGQWGAGVVGPVIVNAGVPFRITDDGTTIDGTTQTAFTGDTNPNGAEVLFHSTVSNPALVDSGTFAVSSAYDRIIGLGDMDGRNYGIDLLPDADHVTITRCVIRGVQAAIRIQGDHNNVGTPDPADSNTLDALGDGILIQGPTGTALGLTSDNHVYGNVITGGRNGVRVTGNASSNVIGLAGPGYANYVFGVGYQSTDGACIRIESDFNFVEGNFIGLDFTGTAAAPTPARAGIQVFGDQNRIASNAIGGFKGLAAPNDPRSGIEIREGADENAIGGNFVGTDRDGLFAIPNEIGITVGSLDPLLPPSNDNRIAADGFGGSGNVIANNLADGIVVRRMATGTRISQNSIHSNHSQGGLGIDLGADGPTPNDAGDGDTGPNLSMNWPVLHSAISGPSPSGPKTVVLGSLDSPNAELATIELFTNPPPFPPGATVEARTYIGHVTPSPNGSFVFVMNGNVLGAAITATATDAAGNTSEISLPVTGVSSPWQDLGNGTLGGNGVPLLVGGGTFAVNTAVGFGLSHAASNAAAFIVLGASPVNLPLLSGILVPNPTVVVPVPTDSLGNVSLIFTWPGAPSGSTVFAQFVIVDPAGALGVAFSNAVVGTSP